MIDPSSARIRLVLGVLFLAALAPPLAGSAQTPQGGDSVLATPRQSYDASAFRAFSFLRQQTPLISVTVAKSDETTRTLIGLGFSF